MKEARDDEDMKLRLVIARSCACGWTFTISRLDGRTTPPGCFMTARVVTAGHVASVRRMSADWLNEVVHQLFCLMHTCQ